MIRLRVRSPLVSRCAIGGLTLLASVALAAPSPAPVEGVFSAGMLARVVVERLEKDYYRLHSTQGWEGVGILDGNVYRGVFRFRPDAPEALGGRMGVHTIDWTAKDHPRVVSTFIGSPAPPAEETWTRMAVQTPADPDRPRIGDFVYAEHMPQAIHREAPVYPTEAREAGIDGLVVVKALVLKDGGVAETWIEKSRPGLDEAAARAVRQYRFKPAMARGEPVAIWIAVPVRFTLH